jgi:hypothetical protein
MQPQPMRALLEHQQLLHKTLSDGGFEIADVGDGTSAAVSMDYS